jgi:hypothetical protein
MWLNLSECSASFCIYSILEKLEKQLVVFCAFYFNWEGGHLRSAVKRWFGLAVMNWCNSQFKVILRKITTVTIVTFSREENGMNNVGVGRGNSL